MWADTTLDGLQCLHCLNILRHSCTQTPASPANSQIISFFAATHMLSCLMVKLFIGAFLNLYSCFTCYYGDGKLFLLSSCSKELESLLHLSILIKQFRVSISGLLLNLKYSQVESCQWAHIVMCRSEPSARHGQCVYRGEDCQVCKMCVWMLFRCRVTDLSLTLVTD